MKRIQKRRDGISQGYWVKRRVQKKGKIVETRSGGLVKRTANFIVKKLTPFSKKIMIAGSIRRKVPGPIDIDIVLIPKDKQKIYSQFAMLDTVRSGPKSISARVRGISVDVYFADEGDWGAMLLTYTGSYGHNIGLRKIAQTKCMLLNQYGLWKNGKRIAGDTEESIYTALDRPRYKQPEERQ